MKSLFGKITWWPWVLGLLVVLPAVLPIFQPRLFRVHDYTHVVRLAEMDQTVREGGVPPLWSKNLGFGYGMPLFSFYAPLPYYVGIAIHAVGLSYETTVKALFFVVTVLSFMAMYGYLKQFLGKPAAFMSGTLFIYAPYRAVDMYVRGALGELFGILFIVLCLWSVTLLLRAGGSRWLVVSALAVAGLLLSHNLMAFIGLPLVLVWSLGLTIFDNRLSKRRLWLLGAVLVLGVGISSYYTIPALAEKQFTSVDELTRGEGSFEHHFVYLRQLIDSPFGYGGSIAGIDDGISFELGKIHIMLMAAALMLYWTRGERNRAQTYLLGFSSAMVAVSVFLMNGRAEPVWNLMPLMPYLQFPWRFLSLTLIFMAVFGGMVIHRLYRRGLRVQLSALAIAVAVVVVYYLPLYQPEYYPDADNPIYSTNQTYVREVMSAVIPDYIHPRVSYLVLDQEKHITVPNSRFEVVGSDTVWLKVISDKAQSFVLEVTGQGEAEIRAHIFDFPGWQWQVDGKKINHKVDEVLPTMSVSLSLTQGATAIIEAKLTQTPVRMVSGWLSLASLGCVGLVSLAGLKRHER